MYELRKIGKVFRSKSVGTGPSSYEKKNLPGRGLTEVEKHCSTCFEWINCLLIMNSYSIRNMQWIGKCKGKAVPLQAWGGPEGSRKLKFPDFMKTAQDGGKVVSLTHRPLLPPGNAPGTHFCYSLSRPQGLVQSEGRHQLGSNQRPSALQHSTLSTVPPQPAMQRIDYLNKLRKKIIFSWFLLSKCTTMHGPENVKSEDGGNTFLRNVLNSSFSQGAST